jgi:ankyrin repeat protein
MEDDRLAAVLHEIASLPEFSGISSPSVTMRSHAGDTPLHVVCIRGDRGAVHLLLEAGADPNAVGEHGCTPLHKALEQEHLQVARMLVAAGASLDATNRDGVTPRDLAKDVPLWEGAN